jgi:transcription termination factor NusB
MQSLMPAFARSGVSSIVYKSSKSISSYRYLSGLNGIHASRPSRRLDDDLDIPPLDLVSVLEVAKAKEAEQSANKATVELARNDIEIPPLDLLSALDVANAKEAEKITNTPAATINLLSIVQSESETNHPIDKNLSFKTDRIDTPAPSLLSVVPSPTVTSDRASKSIPYFAIGAEQSYQLSGRAKGLAEEITNLKRKLKTKINKSHAARLVHEIEKKQRKIDELMNPVTSSVKALGLVTNKDTASGSGSFAAPESNRLSVVPFSTSNEDVSGRAKGLAEEITNLKRKLKTIKNKSHAARLAQEIERKRRKIDTLTNPGTKTEVTLSQIAQGLSREIILLQMRYKNEDMTADRKAKLKHEIEMKQRKVDRLNKGELSNQDIKKLRERGVKPIAPPRETKSYVLPLPKASSKGVLIPQFDSEVIRTQASGTVLASSGTTSILSTVILVPPEQSAGNNIKTFEHAVHDCIQKRSAANGSLFLPLQVEYRERWHASGKIPTHNQRRRDNSGPLTEREVLASRAIDRTLRPWLMKGLGESTTSDQWSGLLPENIVVNCQVQSYDTRSSTCQHRTHADPTALAINSAIAAIYQSTYSGNTRLHVPIEAAASIKLAMRHDGTVIYDPTPSEAEECAFELLFAGTRDKVLMFEFSAKGESVLAENNEYNIDPGISEDVVSDALRLAKEAILPIIQHQEDARAKYSNTRADEANISDDELARILGLGSVNRQQNDEAIISWSGESALGDRDYVQEVEVNTLLDEAYDFVWSKLENAALKSFGYGGLSCNESSTSRAYVYQGNLPSKNLRYVSLLNDGQYDVRLNLSCVHF